MIAVRWRPPPIHANLPAFTMDTISGISVVSPAPHTKRGRTDIVAKPSRLAASTAASARALVAE